MFFRTSQLIKNEREVVLIAFVAFAFYACAFWWGLPHATHAQGVHGWDVDGVTGLLTLSELHNLVLGPEKDWWLAYPVFHYLLLGALYFPYLAYVFLTGGLSQPTDIYPYGMTDPVSTLRHLVLIGRFVTVLMASAVVANTYLTARTIWDTSTARLAAIAIALPAPMVYYSRTGNLDIPVLFWMTLAVLMIARSLKYGFTVKRAVLIGIFSAVAVSTKDQAYAPLIIGMVALMIVHIRNSPETDRWRSPLTMVGTGFFAFVLSSGLVFAPTRFFKHIEFVLNFKSTFWNVANLDLLHDPTPHGYFDLNLEIWQYLLMAIGPVLLVVGVIGLLVSWRAEVFTKLLLGMLLAHVLFVIFPIMHMQYRYTLFPIFVFSFFIARAFGFALERPIRAKAIAMGVLLLGFSWLALRSIDLTYQMVSDSRYAAAEWLETHASTGDKIAFVSLTQIPHLPPGTSAIDLIEDPEPLSSLVAKEARFLLLQTDFSSERIDKYSRFFPAELYDAMVDGSLDYEKKAVFVSKSLFTGFLLDLPLVTPHLVNPRVTIFELADGPE